MKSCNFKFCTLVLNSEPMDQHPYNKIEMSVPYNVIHALYYQCANPPIIMRLQHQGASVLYSLKVGDILKKRMTWLSFF